MATTTSITTTYAGDYSGQIISAALLSGNTLSSGALTIKQNVNPKGLIVRRLETDGLVRGGTCDFQDTSTVTSTERVLTTKELQVNLELCKRDWLEDWDGMKMGASAFRNMPKNIQAYIVQYVAAKVAESTEVSIWQGSGSSDDYDGFETLLAADADLPAANEVLGTTIDASNVIEELTKIYAAIPSRLYGNAGLKMFVSQNIYKSYAIALGGFGAQGQGANGIGGQGTNQGFGGLQFANIPLVVCNGLSANVALVAESSNLWFGTALMSDWNQVKILDMADIDGSQNVRVIMRFLAGVQYGVAEDIVTYGIDNSAN